MPIKDWKILVVENSDGTQGWIIKRRKTRTDPVESSLKDWNPTLTAKTQTLVRHDILAPNLGGTIGLREQSDARRYERIASSNGGTS